MTKFKIFSLLVFVASLAFVSSCDCPLEPTTSYALICAPREATITKFDAKFTESYFDNNGDGTTDSIGYTPVETFSIHSFLFPSDKKFSGSTPNDSRFTENQNLAIKSLIYQLKTYNNTKVVAGVYDTIPDNESIQGDFLVSQVIGNSAKIRVRGKIAKASRNLATEGSNDFCTTFSSFTQTELNLLRTNSVKYGGSQKANFTIADIQLKNTLGFSVTDPLAIAAFNTEYANTFLAEANKLYAQDVDVKIGDMFYYQSVNGREFIFAVTDIRTATLSPFKSRLTIMFNELN